MQVNRFNSNNFQNQQVSFEGHKLLRRKLSLSDTLRLTNHILEQPNADEKMYLNAWSQPGGSLADIVTKLFNRLKFGDAAKGEIFPAKIQGKRDVAPLLSQKAREALDRYNAMIKDEMASW